MYINIIHRTTTPTTRTTHTHACILQRRGNSTRATNTTAVLLYSSYMAVDTFLFAHFVYIIYTCCAPPNLLHHAWRNICDKQQQNGHQTTTQQQYSITGMLRGAATNERCTACCCLLPFGSFVVKRNTAGCEAVSVLVSYCYIYDYSSSSSIYLPFETTTTAHCPRISQILLFVFVLRGETKRRTLLVLL